jgi:predicted nucleotidyltransferase
MYRDQIISALKGYQSELQRMGVESMSLFGSIARDQAGPESDIDLLVRYDRKARVSLLDVIRIENHLARLLGRHVQLVSDPIKRARVRERVEAERIHVF